MNPKMHTYKHWRKSLMEKGFSDPIFSRDKFSYKGCYIFEKEGVIIKYFPPLTGNIPKISIIKDSVIVSTDKAKEHLNIPQIIDAIFDIYQTPLCINIEWAKPLIEHLLKTGKLTETAN